MNAAVLVKTLTFCCCMEFQDVVYQRHCRRGFPSVQVLTLLSGLGESRARKSNRYLSGFLLNVFCSLPLPKTFSLVTVLNVFGSGMVEMTSTV